MKTELTVNIKKLHPNAVTPTYAKPGDAGMDLTAIANAMDENGNHVYHTGLAFEIPVGHVGLLFPRSSISKTDLTLSNSVGVIDSGYRGEVTFKFRSDGAKRYNVGDRIGQIIIVPFPTIALQVVDELSKSERGEGGYGSTGN